MSLAEIVREWGRLGVIGFGGPPVHFALFRDRFVRDRGWIDAEEFEDALAAANLLPGPASTQLAIFFGWRLYGALGGLLGGLAFVLPGLVMVLALSVLFFSSAPPEVVLAAGAGAGAAIAPVVIAAAWGLIGPSWGRAGGRRRRWLAYLLAGLLVAAAAGGWVVVVLLACGAIEAVWRGFGARGDARVVAWPLLLAAFATGTGGAGALVWVSLKVGLLAYGGSFVIIPLMESDVVDTYGWMTAAEFLNAVALGQVTPGPIVHTIAAVGYAAGGMGAGLLAAAVAFAPSFAMVLAGGRHFEQLRGNAGVKAFLDGAAPAAIGAILGVAIPLAAALEEPWQAGVLVAALLSLFVLRRGIVATLLACAAAGVAIVALGAPLP